MIPSDDHGAECRQPATATPVNDQGALWSQVARQRQSTHGRSALPVYRRAAELWGLPVGAKILDAGCGSGEGSKFLAQTGLAVFGNDFAAGMVELARENVPGATFAVASTEALPFADRQFDGAVAVNSVHFCPNPLKALRELRRTVKPGGTVVINCLSPREGSGLAEVCRAMLKLVPPEHRRDPGLFDPFRIAAVGVIDFLMEDSGFVDLRDAYVDCSIEFDSLSAAVTMMKNIAITLGVIKLRGTETVEPVLESVLAEMRIGTTGRVRVANPARLVIGTVPADR